ncbi:MAG: hypothetical protein NTV75_02220 [Bacteroidia bacterium]|nr:hypothetical protein [Bacteroidia bacterium]
MKKVTLGLIVALFSIISISASAQETKGAWTTGADFYNRYNWRGSDFGNSPVVQPTIKYVDGGFTLGAWGSYSLSGVTTATEADLFMTYAFKSGFSLTLTDYYFPAEPGSVGNYTTYKAPHMFEISPGFTSGKFSIVGNYAFANVNNDIYVEAALALKTCSIFVGAGNEQYSSDKNFNVVNLGLSTTKTIAISDKFSLPLTGKVILNPEKDQIFFVLGFTL